MVFPIEILWVFAVAMVLSAIGFKNYIWFFSIGYGFAIAGEGILLLSIYRNSLSIGTVICCALFIVYGLRLGGFLALREFKSNTYMKNMKSEIKDSSTIPLGVKIAIWVACSLLYVTQVSGVMYRLDNICTDNIFVYIGAFVMLVGFVIEAAADIQKNNAKKKNSKRFVDTGLYRLVRCPNYFGEMLFWTGAVVSGIGAISGWQWLIVALGYIGITYVMLSGARRLEIRQNKNYGNDPEYQKYVKSVPIMFPLIPLYSVEKYKWFVA
ncbi:MAG: DUF1295 domain-containing protein [Clostridia bacterium]|nr:DUF1295 domain-containing protein [Clostridia bacterium]